jgi:hypothetical protein
MLASKTQDMWRCEIAATSPGRVFRSLWSAFQMEAPLFRQVRLERKRRWVYAFVHIYGTSDVLRRNDGVAGQHTGQPGR